MKQYVEVWLDVDFLNEPARVGELAHDRGQIWFSYDKEWLHHPACFTLDPDLTLDAGPFFPRADPGNFGIFLDSAPDRWGQTLMKRREALQAKDEGRPARALYPWDFVLGVQDITRQGALRFRSPEDGVFVSAEALSIPPFSSLRELEAVALELTGKNLQDLDALRRWLAVLVAPGASLGGARPKANFLDMDGALWIAKFPARDDDRNIGAWEWVVHLLAEACRIDVPSARVCKYGKAHHTFCVRRFDRDEGGRRFYASALTMLRKEQSEGTSYLDMADFVRKNGSPRHIQADLQQLFKRVAFNVAVGNRDDHLRNHGFLLSAEGWRLAPAFDINPSMDRADHVLNIDEMDNRPALDTVLATAEFYGLAREQALLTIQEVQDVVREWPREAQAAGIARAEIQAMTGAFSAVTTGVVRG